MCKTYTRFIWDAILSFWTYPVVLVNPNCAGESNTILNHAFESKVITVASRYFYQIKHRKEAMDLPALAALNAVMWLARIVLNCKR